jgi:hypothetical protein
MYENRGPGHCGRSAGAKKNSSNKSATNKRTTATTQAVYVLRLRSLRGGDDIGRLRALLKVLLRHFGFRCLSIEPEPRP